MSDNRITIPQVRQLKELENGLDLHLNEEKFAIIVAVYQKACDRLLKEADGREVCTK